MRSELKNTNGSIVLLLGAGASIEAKIPHTAKMIQEINSLLNDNREWKKYKPIYNHLRKLYGKEEIDENGKSYKGDLNIEELVSTLEELLLLLNGNHPLYPFFNNWVDMFESLYGFTDIKDFRDKIEDKLKEWIVPPDYNLNYYRHLLNFAKENPGSGLRVFTLNYDRCVEEAFNEYNDIAGVKLERGFGIEKQGCVWHTRNFDEKNDIEKSLEGNKDKYLFLYKMHGSIDWGRNDKYELIKINGQNIKELIFGVKQKVKAHDPYLYYVYQFRTYTLTAKLIVVCGYSFFDSHINQILHQALINNPTQKILICHYLKPEVIKSFSPEELISKKQQLINEYKAKDKLNISANDQIYVDLGSASEFFANNLQMDYLQRLFPEDEIEKLFFNATDNDEV